MTIEVADGSERLDDDHRREAIRVGDRGVHREVSGLRVVAYDIPEGCIGAYYPECNPLIPVWHHAEESKVPAAKSIPVTIRKAAANCAMGDARHG